MWYSQAMETHNGYVYLIRNAQAGRLKIGYSNNPAGRLRTLQTGSAEYLELLRFIPGTQNDEKNLHKRFKALRIHHEWFQDSPAIHHYFTGTAPRWKWIIVGVVGFFVSILSAIAAFNPQ